MCVYLFALRARRLPAQIRRQSSTLTPSSIENVKSWIARQRVPSHQPALFDHINSSHLKALGCTLPTLDGTIPASPHRRIDFSDGAVVSPGHLLAFCNPHAPERELEPDATIRFLAPPAPFVRRMWAGGKFEFKRPVHVGDNIRAERTVSNIEAKRLDLDNPMIIVEQTIDTRIMENLKPSAGSSLLGDVCVRETRSHVYVPLTNKRRVRQSEHSRHGCRRCFQSRKTRQLTTCPNLTSRSPILQPRRPCSVFLR